MEKEILDKNHKKKYYSVLVLASSIFMLLMNAINTIWHFNGANLRQGFETYETSFIITRVFCSLALFICVASAVAMIIHRVKIESLIMTAIPLYFIFVFICMAAILFGINNEWLRVGGFMIYAPAATYLGLFVMAYLVSKYKTYDIYYFVIVFGVTVVIPSILTAFGLQSMAASAILFPSVIILSIKLVIDKKLPSKWLIVLIALAAMLFFIALLMITKNPNLANRFNIAATGGENDPQGSGWMYWNLTRALKSTPLFGKSPYSVSLSSTVSVPAYLYFADCDIVYWTATLALRFGWISLILQYVIIGALSFSLLRLSGYASNNFSKYFTFSAAVLFIIRTLASSVACYLFFLHGVYLPLIGDMFSVIIDVILCVSAVALCNKRQVIKSDAIDREYHTDGFISYAIDIQEKLVTAAKEKMNSLAGLEEDETAELKAEISQLRDSVRELEDAKAVLESGDPVTVGMRKQYASAITKIDHNETRHQVFISYNHNDYDYAKYLASQLEDKGIKSWYAERNIVSNSYAARIVKALNESRVFVVLLTKSANESEHVFNEVALAFEMIKDGLTIMPVIIDDIVLSDDLHYYLCRQEQTYAVSPPIEKQLEKFSRKIKTVYENSHV